MLHPKQFEGNEAWIAFKLNDRPIYTERDGDFDFIALMDVASCFILGSTPEFVKFVKNVDLTPVFFTCRDFFAKRKEVTAKKTML